MRDGAGRSGGAEVERNRVAIGTHGKLAGVDEGGEIRVRHRQFEAGADGDRIVRNTQLRPPAGNTNSRSSTAAACVG